MIVLALGNVLTAVADGFAMLMIARVVLGIGMGVVWGMASAIAARLVAPRSVALAVSFALGGVASASVLGVPLGTVVGNAFGWRVAFAVLAALAVLVAAGLIFLLPVLGRRGGTAPGPRRSLARPSVITGLIVVGLVVMAHFAAYTYIRPALETLSGLTATSIAGLLLLYGVFGLIGNLTAGFAAGRRPVVTVLLLSGGITVALVVFAFFGRSGVVAGIAVALWGAAYGGLSVSGQLWVTAAEPDRSEHVTGVYVGVFTAAIALGAAAGGWVIKSVGVVALLLSASALALGAGFVGIVGRGPTRGSGVVR